MPAKTFKDYIEDLGNVNYAQAEKFADIGDEFIKMAMSKPIYEDFANDANTLQIKVLKELLGNEVDVKQYEKFKLSNMACCLLYAQTRANFSQNQGYGKGANINTFGEMNESNQTINNLITYFYQPDFKGESAYIRPSTHTKWREEKAEAKGEFQLGIDFPDAIGAIPSPQKGIHHLHLVSGYDKGTRKLLVKPENWGFKSIYNKI